MKFRVRIIRNYINHDMRSMSSFALLGFPDQKITILRFSLKDECFKFCIYITLFFSPAIDEFFKAESEKKWMKFFTFLDIAVAAVVAAEQCC
ncbi:hypothetical protein X798_01117 [Onchocerca flexuosa]|uniref:Uncharacterized protein n=1 Tax=Onchocerca flexuosa TaxID=387005 RepID=A0A238C451_9BILA|nr:hypothetical protein X798_01117 [Onchocerca flexuosa]